MKCAYLGLNITPFITYCVALGRLCDSSHNVYENEVGTIHQRDLRMGKDPA